VLGTRASLAVDFTYLMTLIAPVASWASFRLARSHREDLHRRIQMGVLVLCVVSVLAFEANIRVAGGSGAFLAQAPEHAAASAGALLWSHISIAVITYGIWTYLAIVSSRRFRVSLPGAFSKRHKRIGKLVFVGLWLTAASATGMYFLAFVM
jgi:hypothetical protein